MLVVSLLLIVGCYVKKVKFDYIYMFWSFGVLFSYEGKGCGLNEFLFKLLY